MGDQYQEIKHVLGPTLRVLPGGDTEITDIRNADKINSLLADGHVLIEIISHHSEKLDRTATMYVLGIPE
jgi:hypothetical protein